MGLNIPSGVAVQPTHCNEISQPLLLLPSYALHDLHGSNVANEALSEVVDMGFDILLKSYHLELGGFSDL